MIIAVDDSDVIGRLLPPRLDKWKVKRDKRLAKRQKKKEKAQKKRVSSLAVWMVIVGNMFYSNIKLHLSSDCTLSRPVPLICIDQNFE